MVVAPITGGANPGASDYDEETRRLPLGFRRLAVQMH